jgi:hypothetical protein
MCKTKWPRMTEFRSMPVEWEIYLAKAEEALQGKGEAR